MRNPSFFYPPTKAPTLTQWICRGQLRCRIFHALEMLFRTMVFVKEDTTGINQDQSILKMAKLFKLAIFL